MSLKNTWVTGETYAASDQNTVATAVNANASALIALGTNVKSAVVATSESTSSATYTDLTTTTDTVTVTIGASGVAMVLVSAATILASGAGGNPILSFALSGANTQAASDTYSSGVSASQISSLTSFFVLTGLSAGSTTFKLKYRVSGATWSYLNRRIAVIPFP